MKHNPDLITVRDGALLIVDVKVDDRPAAVLAMRITEAAGAREVRLPLRHEANDSAGVITGPDT